jgi:hypothetical protein
MNEFIAFLFRFAVFFPIGTIFIILLIFAL